MVLFWEILLAKAVALLFEPAGATSQLVLIPSSNGRSIVAGCAKFVWAMPVLLDASAPRCFANDSAFSSCPKLTAVCAVMCHVSDGVLCHSVLFVKKHRSWNREIWWLLGSWYQIIRNGTVTIWEDVWRSSSSILSQS